MPYFSKIVTNEGSICTFLHLPEFYCITMKSVLSASNSSEFSWVPLCEYTPCFNQALQAKNSRFLLAHRFPNTHTLNTTYVKSGVKKLDC